MKKLLFIIILVKIHAAILMSEQKRETDELASRKK